MHDWGMLEAGAWLACGGFLLEAKRHGDEDIALYIAITGLALACPALAYSTFRHAGKIKGGDPRSLHRMVSMWLSITSALLAMPYDSTLLGYVSVIALYGAVGIYVGAFGLCLALGFEDDNAME